VEAAHPTSLQFMPATRDLLRQVREVATRHLAAKGRHAAPNSSHLMSVGASNCNLIGLERTTS
jgi:hypothetical protein